LSACRETLNIYHIMRSDNSAAFSMVKLVDYQAFICSALLLLGLLGYGNRNPVPLSLAIDEYHDGDKVHSILEILREASRSTHNSLASQAVEGLETLAMLVKAGKSGYSLNPNTQPGNQSAKITIPGSGVVSVVRGKYLDEPTTSSAEPPPTFHLSHGISQDYTSQELPRPASQSFMESNALSIPDPDLDILMVDFDWTSMVGMDLEDEWAWLADANSGIL
jgi:hypothetical protein